MEEIKETKTKRIIKFLIDHIMVISAIIFLCILLFSSCSTAKAAEYNPSEVLTITKEDLINNYCSYLNTNNSNKASLINICNTFSNDFDYITVNFCPVYSSSTSVYCITFYNDDYLGISGNSYFVTKNLNFSCAYVVFNNSVFNSFRGSCTTGDLINGVYRHFYTSLSYTKIDNNYWLDGTDMNNARGIALNYTFNGWRTNFLYLTNLNIGIEGIGSYLPINKFDTNLNVVDTYNPLFNSIVYSEDSRLRMYITNAIGGPRLNVNVVDFAQSFPYPDQTILQPKEITLTIETDGVESLYTLDPSTAIWASKFWATVPVSDIAELDGNDVVKITKVQFTLYDAFANMTEDFYIATDFALKDTTEEINPSNILPPGNIYEDAKTTAQIDLLIQTLENNGSGSVYGDFTFQSSFPVLPSWSDEITYDLTRMDDNSPNFPERWYDTYPWSFGDLQIDIVEYINDFCNGYASVYDVIIFRVNGWYYDPSFGGNDPSQGSYTTGIKGYIVLYTNKFYNHSTSLTTLDILTAIQSDFNQQKSNWNWLVSRINDFEDKSLEAMNAELRIERDSRDWLKSIWNQIENIEMPIYDDSDLLDKLDLIISEIDEIAGFFTGESGEGYNRFTEWLEKIENDGEITPHEWANDIFNYVTGLYHSLSDGTSYYTEDISDYIDYVNQDGNSDPGNYFFAMYEGTYDPHNYYGWTGGIS